jgi:excisionase family DNA binding protein
MTTNQTLSHPVPSTALNLRGSKARNSPRPASAVPSADFTDLPSVLTSREAANVLRIGLREVRALVDTGQLAGTRLGPRKVIRISRAAVLDLMGVPSVG